MWDRVDRVQGSFHLGTVNKGREQAGLVGIEAVVQSLPGNQRMVNSGLCGPLNRRMVERSNELGWGVGEGDSILMLQIRSIYFKMLKTFTMYVAKQTHFVLGTN